LKRPLEFVLDASAILAFLKREAGGAGVHRFLDRRSGISAVNWAETLTKLADSGEDPLTAGVRIRSGEMLGASLAILPFGDREAGETACLRKATHLQGLSLGDRACLATARLLKAAAVTADRSWSKLDIGVQIHVIRT